MSSSNGRRICSIAAHFFLTITTSITLLASIPFCHGFGNFNPVIQNHPNVQLPTRITSLNAMKRPILDQLASTLFQLETKRVTDSSIPDEKGRIGEPMEWSEESSLANQFSNIVASNSLGYKFKQLVADIVAGEYDVESTQQKIETFVSTKSSSTDVVMFSFTTCPFCRSAKDYLDEQNIPYTSMELDELEGNKGNEIRATLGKMVGRTSVPSIFIKGTCIGGMNDGMPGLRVLGQSGELEKMLQ